MISHNKKEGERNREKKNINRGKTHKSSNLILVIFHFMKKKLICIKKANIYVYFCFRAPNKIYFSFLFCSFFCMCRSAFSVNSVRVYHILNHKIKRQSTVQFSATAHKTKTKLIRVYHFVAETDCNFVVKDIQNHL